MLKSTAAGMGDTAYNCRKLWLAQCGLAGKESVYMPVRSLAQLWRDEFRGYAWPALRQDVVAGINVAAVALPLALAFGVVSGASAQAGLVSAIWAGLIMGLLAGAPYQISGPTGAMGVVLVGLAGRYGMGGVWLASLMAGALLLSIGLLRLGRFVAFIPSPVITGFTSGVALIIAIGQLDSFIGQSTPAASSAALKLWGYFVHPVWPDWHALALGGLVMAVMLAWPASWAGRFPASLAGLIAATALDLVVQWPVATLGAMPATLILPTRLTLDTLRLDLLPDLIPAALTLTTLGALVSLLCGSAASAITGVRLQANQELIAQGVGNLLIPFTGGVPATGAVARTVVGIRAGGRTRLTSVFHSLTLAAFLFGLGPLLARIPLAALSGVLLVTCWRMNDWPTIRYITQHRLKTAMGTFALTVLATTLFDLTTTVLLGVFVSGALFLNQISQLGVEVRPVEAEKLRQRGLAVTGTLDDVRVAYLTGPLFFAAVGHFNEAFANLDGVRVLILSMRGVPLIDASGLQTLLHLARRLKKHGGHLMLAGVNEPVLNMLERGDVVAEIGAENIFWSADQALAKVADS